MFLAPLLLSFVQATVAPAIAPQAPPSNAVNFGSRHGGRLFISPMGEPFRPKARDDDGLADWFQQADRNHDGMLTLEEMQQDADRFFALLDINHDGEIDPDEISRYEKVVAPEIQTGDHYDLASLETDQANSEGDGRGGHGGRGGRRGAEEGRAKSFFKGNETDQHQGAGRYGLLDLPEPVVAADANFDRGVSQAEFRAAAQQRFLALDLDHKGYLTLSVLESIRPAPPPGQKKPEANPDEVDVAGQSPLPPDQQGQQGQPF